MTSPTFVVNIYCTNILRMLQLTLARISKSPLMEFEDLWRWTKSVPLIALLPIILNMVARPIMAQRPPNFKYDFYLSLSTLYIVLLLAWWRAMIHGVDICSKQLLAHYKVIYIRRSSCTEGKVWTGDLNNFLPT
jgi:hypothetical protein